MKALTSSLLYLVVQKGRLSNKEALAAILSGRVQVNGKPGGVRQVLLPQDTVTLNAAPLKLPQAFTYLVYYKPRGIESTLNPAVAHNLREALPTHQHLFPVGRLDKESEGLLLLTDDGGLYNRIAHPIQHQEKEYEVTVDKYLTPEALTQLATGVVIMGQKTRPAHVRAVTDTTFRIVLTQGLNRQIRRMCYKLGYTVLQLVRIRLVNLELGPLASGEWRYLTEPEKEALFLALPK